MRRISRWMVWGPLVSMLLVANVSAASTFADPAFQQQWQAGEASTPNFWGPLANAKDGQQEPYKEATGGMRLVQYFDKGRMELTNGAVTNGLLASEIVKGQIQTGDATFQQQAPPAIPIAGDPDNPGPTYANLNQKAATLLTPATAQVGASVTAMVAADGTPSTGTAQADTGTMIAAFDDATKHNVPAVFATYRTKAGLLTIGLAISEPFLANVKVAGQPKAVMVQVFERRILTYTASNPAAFQVEMGNIGQHYAQWRYPNGAPSATAATPGSGQQIATWTDADGQIQIHYPSNWMVGPGRSNTHIVAQFAGPTDDLSFSVSIDVTHHSDLDGEASDITDNLHNSTTYTHKVNAVTRITIGGESALALTAEATSKSDPNATHVYEAWVLHHNGKEFLFQTNYLHTLPPEVDAIIASVIFLK